MGMDSQPLQHILFASLYESYLSLLLHFMVFGLRFTVYIGPENIIVFGLVWLKNFKNLDHIENRNFKNKKIRPDHLDRRLNQILKVWFDLQF